ncbi:carbohydrate kinase family protein [Kitasatospora sp. NPDC052896]|uniref:carbohydrate kinase family protein n=1 Tax=Kitasatospora sp. NPDC052896 TaxID=3364061 RepID=UPI0037C672D5
MTDIVARHQHALAPGTDTAARIAVRPGGSGANTAAWAAHGGARTRLLARVGSDSATWHHRALEATGVDPVLTVDPDHPTAVVICLVDATAERTLATDSGAAAHLGPADWDPALLTGVAHLHLSGYLCFTAPGRALAARAIADATARSVPVSCDPASTGFLRRLGTAAFEAAIEGTSLLLPNLAEAVLLSGTDDPVAAAERLSARWGEAVLTLGPDGALAARAGTLQAHSPAPPTTAIDTTGAGDAFTGTFLAARLAGTRLTQALRTACHTAALATTLVGGRPATR